MILTQNDHTVSLGDFGFKEDLFARRRGSGGRDRVTEIRGGRRAYFKQRSTIIMSRAVRRRGGAERRKRDDDLGNRAN